MSDELVQPISGSCSRAEEGSNSSTQSLVLAMPDCMADFVGRKMRASMILVLRGRLRPLIAGHGIADAGQVFQTAPERGLANARFSGPGGWIGDDDDDDGAGCRAHF